jgi:hypothetical protein
VCKKWDRKWGPSQPHSTKLFQAWQKCASNTQTNRLCHALLAQKLSLSHYKLMCHLKSIILLKV